MRWFSLPVLISLFGTINGIILVRIFPVRRYTSVQFLLLAVLAFEIKTIKV